MAFKSENWINAVYSRVIKNKREDFKLIAMLNRYSNEALMKFNTKLEGVNVVNKPPSVNALQKAKSGFIHYTRTPRKK